MVAWEEKDSIAKLEEEDEASIANTLERERERVCVCGKLPLESSIFQSLKLRE